MIEIKPFDPADHLDNYEVMVHYLIEALRTRDSEIIQRALTNVVRALRRNP